MRKLKMFFVSTLLLAGCGSSGAAPAPPVSQSIDDTLRSDCWFLNDLEISSTIGVLDDAWWLGVTYEEQIQLNRTGCSGNEDCIQCWDSAATAVYFVLH